MLYDLLYNLIIYPIIFIFPAYVANGAPVIFGGGAPLDMNKKLAGNPIFGKHKTVKGLVAGLASGFIIAVVESIFLPYMLFAGVLMTAGTHFGDLLGSFIKRRMGKKEGHKFELLDQYLFLIFALAFAIPSGHEPALYGITFLFAFTWIMHKGTNKAAHFLKLKEVPW